MGRLKYLEWMTLEIPFLKSKKTVGRDINRMIVFFDSFDQGKDNAGKHIFGNNGKVKTSESIVVGFENHGDRFIVVFGTDTNEMMVVIYFDVEAPLGADGYREKIGDSFEIGFNLRGDFGDDVFLDKGDDLPFGELDEVVQLNIDEQITIVY